MDKRTLVQFFHVLFVGSYFIYLFNFQKSIPEFHYKILMALGVGIFCYHLYEFVLVHMKWVNLLHVILVAPLLFAVGYLGKESPRWMFELIGMLGFAGIGYHGFYLLRQLI